MIYQRLRVFQVLNLKNRAAVAHLKRKAFRTRCNLHSNLHSEYQKALLLGTIPAIFDACNLDSAVDYSAFTSLLIDLASIMQKQSDINGPRFNGFI